MKLDKRGKKIIVNALSILRIIGAIIIPILLNTVNIKYLTAAIILFFVSDTLDGLLARYWSVQTRGGALLDPLGDKLLVFSCILSLIKDNNILLIPLLLELIITVHNVWYTLHGEIINVTMCGKIKMWPLSITLILAAINRINPNILKFLNIVITSEVIKYSAIITIILEVATIISYFTLSIKNKKNYNKNIVKFMSIKEIISRLFDTEAYKEDKNKPLMDVIKK